tara:strand:- start:8893 stop:9162 length:270 start_codon:yes stop_codon:yes gene_type:complete
MATLRNDIIKVKEMKNNFKAVEAFDLAQFPKDRFNKKTFRTITKKKVEKFGLGEIIGLRVYNVISTDENYFFGEMITGSKWVFENGERN